MLTTEMPTLEEARRAISAEFRLAAGTMREVYHIPGSKWVYKVDIRASGGFGGNTDEYEAYLAKKDNLPNGIYVPLMVMLEAGILAAEFIDGVKPPDCGLGFHCCLDRANCFWTFYSRTIQDVTRDAFFENIVIDKTGKIYIIDLGHDNPHR